MATVTDAQIEAARRVAPAVGGVVILSELVGPEDDPEVRIYGMEFELHALTKQMAAECRTETGAPRCYVCHRTDGLRCTAPGWGGVWACDDCRSQ